MSTRDLLQDHLSQCMNHLTPVNSSRIAHTASEREEVVEVQLATQDEAGQDAAGVCCPLEFLWVFNIISCPPLLVREDSHCLFQRLLVTNKEVVRST